jgi:phage gp36-like protein
MAVTQYCSWSDVQKRISAEAADLRLDDDPSAREDVLDEAAVEVNGYLQLAYEVPSLALSTWVRFRARDIAVYLLCLRRNHPVPNSVQQRYDDAIELLEKVRQGQMRLPDVAEDKASVPVLSNQRVEMIPFPRLKTVTGKSTGSPEGYSQHTDTTDTFDYSI